MFPTTKSGSTLLTTRPRCSGASPCNWYRLTAMARLLHCLRTRRTRSRVAEESAFVGTTSQLSVAPLPAAVRGLPGVEGGISFSATEASVLLRDRGGRELAPALRAAPAYFLLFLSPVWVVLKLLLLLEYRVLGPPESTNCVQQIQEEPELRIPLNACYVKGHIASATTPNGVCSLDRTDAY